MTGTVTFLCSDIEGSTQLLKQLGRERYTEVLADQQRLLREVFAAHGGEEVDTQGDSFLVAFRSAQDALRGAVVAQRAIVAHDWPDGSDLRVRIGIHSGDADSSEGRYVGLAVHRAARIGAAAHGGQVLVSSATRELVEDDLGDGISFVDVGTVRLKDFDRPERIAQVEADSLERTFPALAAMEKGESPFVEIKPIVRIRWSELKQRFRKKPRT
jgi:class 3 adenylate cyclase